jgi:hypothetical protein
VAAARRRRKRRQQQYERDVRYSKPQQRSAPESSWTCAAG